MSYLYGALTVADAAATVTQVGQQIVWDATQAAIAAYNADMQAALRAFVEREDEQAKFSYMLAGGGYLQERGPQSELAAVKGAGKWDVALPLKDYGAQIVVDDVALAYLSVQEYDRAVETVFTQDRNTMRREMLKALLNNTAPTFLDPRLGSLTIQPLANGDAVLYPPLIGSAAEATANHYIETGYLASAISGTNNPLITIRDTLGKRFGEGDTLIAFFNSAQRAVLEALPDFVSSPSGVLVPGALSTTVQGVPQGFPGQIIGYSDGVWISLWDWVPASYSIALDADQPRPLIQRRDTAASGLGTGLQLVQTDRIYPFQKAHWRHRFGFGVGNRLNGMVLEFGNGGSYTIPTGYS